MIRNFFCRLLLGAVLFLIFSSSVSRAQIPNAGFENWANGTPDGGWQVSNGPGLTTITQSTSAHSGTYALEGTTVSVYGQSIPAVATIVFPFTQRPTDFVGYYKFSSAGSDSFVIAVAFSKNGNAIGGYTVVIGAASAYTKFDLPIFWATSDSPDSCYIAFETTGYPSFHAGTTYYVDDISFEPVTAIDQGRKSVPVRFQLDQNFPNPFNPTTEIRFAVPSSGLVTLIVYDALGREVRTLVNKVEQPGSHEVEFNAANLPSGIYFYRLRAGSSVSVKKLVLLK